MVKTLLVVLAATGLYHIPLPEFKYQGEATAVVHFTDMREVKEICGADPRPDYKVLACTKNGVIISPNPCEFPGDYAKIMCHEKAHVLGMVDAPSSNGKRVDSDSIN